MLSTPFRIALLTLFCLVPHGRRHPPAALHSHILHHASRLLTPLTPALLPTTPRNRQVERLLDRVDAAIYLLDYTKLKTAEEAAVLGRLKSVNPGLVGRLCSRLFFAVNKMDQADEGPGLDDEQTRAYVAEVVTRQLNCPDFTLHPDQARRVAPLRGGVCCCCFGGVFRLWQHV